MGKWVVYRKDSSSTRCIVGKIEYNGEWMGACNVTTTVTSPIPINFELGDYIIYRGERFEINYDPTVIKSSSNNTYGEGYKYENVVFNSLSDELVRCGFLDYVLNDNKIHYSSLPNFSFYASNVKDLAENIQANLDRIYTGANKWTVVVHPEFKGRENINVSVNSINCWEALALAKTLFDANFIVKGREITIGTEGIAVDKIFSYGKGNGLLTVERNTDSSQKIITRLRAYGSTRNMPLRYYYNNEEGAPNNLSVQNLMLPSFPTDPDPYIDSSNINELGVREGTVFFDGSNELPEIYPTMEGMTADILEQAGVIVNASGRLDVIVQAEQIEDDGVEVEGMPSTFKVKLKDIGFDLNDYGEATMSMKNGMCGGRDFKVISCEDIGDGYMLECKRTRDDGLDLYFPNKNYNLRTGDEFVFLDIEMPEVYIKVASQRLLNEATAYLNKNCYVKYTYTPEIDNIYLARQHENSLKFGGKSIYMTIKEGDMFLLEDNSLGFDERIIISNLNIVEDDKSDIPQYKVVLSNEKSVGAFDKIQEQIKAIATGGCNSDQLRSLIKTYGSVIFLRKDQDDRSKGKIASDKGFEVGRYVSGSSGAIAYLDTSTGKTVAEIDKLYVRMKAYFETLVIKEANSIGGKQIISPAGAVRLTDVANGEWEYDEKGEPLLDEEGNHIFIPYDGFVRCYFLAEQDGERINHPFEIGDQMYCQLFNAFTGEENSISNKYYWRLLVNDGGKESVKFNNKICYYFDLSNTICDTGSDMPNVGDIVCQRGNIKDLDRQNFLEFSSVDAFSPSVTLFQGVGGRFNEETGEWIADYTLTDKEMVQFAVNKSTGRAFMNLYGDMYVGGRFTVDANGSPVEPKSYLRYTQENGLEIKGKISAQSIYGDSNKTFGDYFNDVFGDIEGIQKQIDGAIESFFYEYAPTLDNYPASEWITDELKESHLNDTFTNLKDGRSWRWTKSDGVYSWTEITDTATVEALRKAGEAQDTADGKRKVYVGMDNPTTPYDKGDLWSRGYAYALLVCINPKKADQFYEKTDWVNADNIDEVSKELEEAKKQLEQDIKDNAEDLKTLSDLLQDTKDYLDGAFKDGIIDSNEKSAISKYINQIETIQAEVEASYTEVYNNELLLDDGDESTAKQNLATAHDKLISSITDLIETINSVIADDKADGDEIASVDFKYEAFNQKYGDYIKALNAARNYIESKLNGKIDQNIEDLGGYAYLKDALEDGKTLMNGGLIQSSILALGKFDNEVGSFTVWSGTSGIYDETKIGGGIASWYGGGNIDMFDYASYDNIGNASFSVPEGVRVAAGADRMDGTGYRANGNLWWDKDGKVHADALSFFVGEESVGKLLASFQSISGNDGKLLYIIPQAPFQNLQVTNDFTVGSGDNKVALKYDKDNNALYVVKPDGSPVNFYATGGISMYGKGDTTVKSVMDLITNNLDPSTLAVHNGLITVIGNTGSEGVSESAVRNIVEGYGFLTDVPSEYITESELASRNYAGKDWVNKKGYLTSIPSEYVTETELTNKGYATTSDLDIRINALINGAPDAYDTLQEIADVLQGNVNSIGDILKALGGKADKAKTLSGYGITDAYTKTEVNTLLNDNATQTWVKSQGYLTQHQDLSGYQKLITSSNKLAYALISGTPTALPNPTALKFGTKSYDGSAERTILASDLGALTSHQTIYTLTFQSGTFASGSFTANSGNKTINIPTTTSHISEGGNLYFTNARAVSALADTLKSYVTLSGTQTISGEKNFTGGLKVNGSPIVYDASKKYWKLEGDLLVTGGVTMYGNDSSFTPSTIMDAIAANLDPNTLAIENGLLTVVGGGSGSISEITKQMVIDALGFTPISSSDVPTALPNPHSLKFGSKLYDGSASKTILASDLGITWDDILGRPTLLSSFTDDVVAGKYLPLSGGAITGEIKFNIADLTYKDISYGIIAAFKAPRVQINELISKYIYLGSASEGDSSDTSLVIRKYSSIADKSPSGTTDLVTIDTSGNVTAIGGFTGNLTGTATKATTADSATYATSAGNAEKLAGYGLNRFILMTGRDYTEMDLNTIGDSQSIFTEIRPSEITTTNSPHNGYGALLSLKDRSGIAKMQLLGSLDSSVLYFRSQQKAGASITSNWKTIAFTDSNVASATKLQTARTIFGQSFDGTGNVSGSINLGKNAIGHNLSDVWTDDEGNTHPWYGLDFSTPSKFATLSDWSGITLRVGDDRSVTIPSGNVGIGTTSPAYKLDVSGTGRFTGDVIINGNTAIHSGNIGSQSVAEATNAFYLKGGLYRGDLNDITLYGDKSFIKRINYNNANIPNGVEYGNLLYISGSGDTSFMLLGDYVNQTLLYRSGINNKAISASTIHTNSWKTIAFTDSNVASATKLQTARTIFGQSFDGTGNVEGDSKANSFIATSSNGLRLAYGNYGTLLRNDGSGFFILLTNSGGALDGSFNTLRPFKIDLATGDIQMESNVFITKSFKLSKRLRVNARESATSFGYLKSNIANQTNIGIAHLGTNYGGASDITREDFDMTAISMYRGIVGIGKEYDYTSLQAIYDAGVDLGLTKGLLIGSAKVLYVNNELNISTSAYINGNILTTGGVTMYSQRNLKNITDERGLSLDELRTIKPTRYTWKDGRDNRIHFGGIADDIQQVLPEVVYNANGVLTMDYGNAGFAIASSLIKPVIDHEQRIKALEKENEELKQEIKRLKA